MKKYLSYSIVAVGLSALVLAPATGLAEEACCKVQASATQGLSVSTENGNAKVTLNGEVVFTGVVEGGVSTASKTVDGVTYAAAFSGDKVLWENAPGAADRLRK